MESLYRSQLCYRVGKEFGLESAKHERTFVRTSVMFSKDEKSKEIDQSTSHRSMIGDLLYLTSSRLDIACSVGFCATNQAQKNLVSQ